MIEKPMRLGFLASFAASSVRTARSALWAAATAAETGTPGSKEVFEVGGAASGWPFDDAAVVAALMDEVAAADAKAVVKAQAQAAAAAAAVKVAAVLAFPVAASGVLTKGVWLATLAVATLKTFLAAMLVLVSRQPTASAAAGAESNRLEAARTKVAQCFCLCPTHLCAAAVAVTADVAAILKIAGSLVKESSLQLWAPAPHSLSEETLSTFSCCN